MATLVFPRVPYENQQVSFAGNVWIWDGVVWNLLNDSTTTTGGTSLEVSDTAPADPQSGSLWFNSLDGNLYVYYEDADSSQWIQPTSSPYGSGGSGGSSFTGGLVTGPTTFASTTQFQGVITAALASNVIPFHYDNQSTFPSAVTYHGAIAHSHADNRMYFAHSGAWQAMANLSDVATLPIASTTVSGAVKIDGTTITINNGVITAVGGGAGGSGTVNAGVAGRLAYYPSSGTAVDDNADLSWSSNILSVTGSIQATGTTSIVRSIHTDITSLSGAVSPVTYSGALAYVSTPGRVYVANGAAWNPLANFADIPSTFANVAVAGQPTVTADNSSDTLTLAGGANISLTTSGNTVTIAATATQSNSFSTIAVAGQSNVVADSSTDTLTLVAGPNITLSTTAGSDTITISATSGGGAATGVSTGTASRLAYYASTGAVVEDTGAGLTWSGTTLTVSGTVTATTFSGSGASLTSIPNAALTNNSIGFVSGGNGLLVSAASAALGGSLTITNTGVTGLSNGTGISLSGSTGSVVVTNTGVTSIVAGTGVSVSAASGAVTISSSGGVSSVVAGTGYISVSTTDGVATVNNTLTKLNYLADASNVVFNGSNLTIDKIALPAATMYGVLFRGLLAYTFTSHIPGDNPTLYALSGTTIAFNLQVPGHPFALQTTGGVNLDPATNTALGTFYWVGTDATIAENSAAQGKITGTLYWIIGPTLSGTYRYQCTLHSAMRGNIVIKNVSLLT